MKRTIEGLNDIISKKVSDFRERNPDAKMITAYFIGDEITIEDCKE